MTSKEPDEYRRERLTARTTKYQTNVARLKLVVDDTRRNLCPHGVDPALCIDHRPAKSATTETEPTTGDAS